MQIFIALCFLNSAASLPSHLPQSAKTFHIPEKSPEGTIVVSDVRQLLGLGNENGRQELLAINTVAIPGADNFRIDQFHGSLVVASPPDRDVICPTDSRGSIDFVSVGISTPSGRSEIFAGDGDPKRHDGFRRSCKIPLSIVYGTLSEPTFDALTIILDDVNDHAPEFIVEVSESEHIIRIYETPSEQYTPSDYRSKQRQKVRIPLPEATDIDAPENGIQHYRLEGDDAYLFHLEIGVGDEGEIASEVNPRRLTVTSEKRLWLVTSRTTGEFPSLLDYEQRKEYRFVLVAVDGGLPPRSGRLPIRLIIEDVNDHAPIFSQSQYAGSMSEDDLSGHIVLQLQATDADGKYENHRIHFRIPSNESKVANFAFSEAQAAAADLFEIELTGLTSYDTQPARTTRRNTTSARLIVQRKPEKQLREAAKRAVEVAKKLQFSKPHTEFDHLRDRPLSSRSNVLRFVIEAFDFGKPSLSSQVPVFVEIVDVNDEAPKIFVNYLSKIVQRGRKEEACGSLIEGVGRSIIAQVTVMDNDATLIATEVVCNLNDSRFSLETIPTLDNPGWPDGGANAGTSRTGQMLMYKLMSMVPLDRESPNGPTVTMLISCTDNQGAELDSKRLTTRSKICIEIEDVNDNPPIFASSVYTFKVPENVPAFPNNSNNRGLRSNRYFIGNVVASDKDTDHNTYIEYSLSPNANGVVEIDSTNGSLFLISPFDREKITEFAFTVIAADQKTPNIVNATSQLSSTAEVRIVVVDVNDCQPEFELSNYNFEVEENVELAEVGRVSAEDADTGDFGRVRYRLSAVNSQQDGGGSTSDTDYQSAQALIMSLFQIDPRLGVIRLRGHLDREKRVHYEFLVLAVDNVPLNGDPASGWMVTRFTATTTVLVMVLDQNDNPPKIHSPRNLAEFMLSSDQMIAGTTVFTIQASDADQGENATVEYALVLPDKPHESTNVTTSEAAAWPSPTSFPFAVDQMAGICYLKQNLPQLSSGGAKAYTFQVRAYDLGVPKSLNSTITVRILRGAKLPGAPYADPTLLNYESQSGEVARTGLSGAGALEGPEWWSEWGGETAGNGAIPSKTLIIIVTAVFAIALLLGILIFIYFRHQKVFSNRALVNGVIGGPRDTKGPEGYATGESGV